MLEVKSLKEIEQSLEEIKLGLESFNFELLETIRKLCAEIEELKLNRVVKGEK